VTEPRDRSEETTAATSVDGSKHDPYKERGLVMSPAHASDATFTIAGILVVLFVLTAMTVLLERRPANLCLTGFLAASLGSPLLFVGQTKVGLMMVAVALAFVVPAYRLALADGDGGGGGHGSDDEPPRDQPPGSDPEHWEEFEREFWSHVDRTRELVHLMSRTRELVRQLGRTLIRPGDGAFVFREVAAAWAPA
jgi:hypothetical protein